MGITVVERRHASDGLATSLSRGKNGRRKNKRERLVILGMLINIHELSSLASILIITGLLSTVSSKLESAIVKEHRRVSLCCIIVLSKHMIGYWFFIKGCRLDRILSSQGPSLPSITSLSRFCFLLPFLPRERLVASPCVRGRMTFKGIESIQIGCFATAVCIRQTDIPQNKG